MRHELLEAGEAQAVLELDSAAFEGLVSGGQLPIFRSEGRICFRRDDVMALSRKRQPSKKSTPAATATAEAPAPKPATRATVTVQPQPAAKKKPKSSKKKYAVIASLVVTALVAAVMTMPNQPKVVSAPTNVAARALPFENYVVAPGLVEPVSGVLNLGFEVAGTLKSVNVVEGQQVKAGDLIAELENGDIQANLAIAQSNTQSAEASYKVLVENLEAEAVRAQREVERLKADLAQLEAGYRVEEKARAQADLKAYEADAARAQEEESRYFDASGRYDKWAKSLYDQAKRNREAADARVTSAKTQVAQMEAGYRVEDKEKARAVLASAQADLNRIKQTQQARLDTAQAQIGQARAQIKLAEANLKKTILKAPVDGVIVWQYLHTGENVIALSPTPVVALADCQNLRVRADIDEADFPKVHKGQRVKISADAYPGQYFIGEVDTICASAGAKNFTTGEAKERRDVKIVETLVKLQPPCPLKLGLRVTGYFEIQKQ